MQTLCRSLCRLPQRRVGEGHVEGHAVVLAASAQRHRAAVVVELDAEALPPARLGTEFGGKRADIGLPACQEWVFGPCHRRVGPCCRSSGIVVRRPCRRRHGVVTIGGRGRVDGAGSTSSGVARTSAAGTSTLSAGAERSASPASERTVLPPRASGCTRPSAVGASGGAGVVPRGAGWLPGGASSVCTSGATRAAARWLSRPRRVRRSACPSSSSGTADAPSGEASAAGNTSPIGSGVSEISAASEGTAPSGGTATSRCSVSAAGIPAGTGSGAVDDVRVGTGSASACTAPARFSAGTAPASSDTGGAFGDSAPGRSVICASTGASGRGGAAERSAGTSSRSAGVAALVNAAARVSEGSMGSVAARRGASGDATSAAGSEGFSESRLVVSPAAPYSARAGPPRTAVGSVPPPAGLSVATLPSGGEASGRGAPNALAGDVASLSTRHGRQRIRQGCHLRSIQNRRRLACNAARKAVAESVAGAARGASASGARGVCR